MTAPVDRHDVRARGPRPGGGPGVLDALSLLAEVVDELVVCSARDTHRAITDRVHGLVDPSTGGASRAAGTLHRAIAGGIYGGLGAGFRGASRGLAAAASTGAGPRLEEDPRGRFLNAAVHGLIGDRLADERPRLAIEMAVRAGGRDVAPTATGLAGAFPGASGRVVVLLHGLCESEEAWGAQRHERGTTYAEELAAQGWTPVLLRANTGLPLRENGVALAALLQRLVDRWPVPVERVALVGHSMGGLVSRAAGAVAAGDGRPHPWTRLVTDVVMLGSPHFGAPLAIGVGHGSRALARLPETAAFGRLLDWRSRGVHDLVVGLGEDVAPLPHARYRLVAATVTRSERHPVGWLLGDLLVRAESAYGRRAGRALFPDGETLHVGGAGHLALLNHPEVAQALRRWLA